MARIDAMANDRTAHLAAVQNYDEAQFCRYVLSDGIGRYFEQRVLGYCRGFPELRESDLADECRAEFCLRMIQSGDWSRWDSKRGNLRQFVCWWAGLFIRNWMLNRARRLKSTFRWRDSKCGGSRVRYGAAMSDFGPAARGSRGRSNERTFVTTRAASRPAADVAREVVGSVRLRVSRHLHQTLDELMRSGGDVGRAAVALGVGREEVLGDLRVVRRELRDAGLTRSSVSTVDEIVGLR